MQWSFSLPTRLDNFKCVWDLECGVCEWFPVPWAEVCDRNAQITHEREKSSSCSQGHAGVCRRVLLTPAAVCQLCSWKNKYACYLYSYLAPAFLVMAVCEKKRQRWPKVIPLENNANRVGLHLQKTCWTTQGNLNALHFILAKTSHFAILLGFQILCFFKKLERFFPRFWRLLSKKGTQQSSVDAVAFGLWFTAILVVLGAFWDSPKKSTRRAGYFIQDFAFVMYKNRCYLAFNESR